MRVRGPDGRFRTPFPFFELPAELRTQIYSLVLSATNNRLGSVHNVRSRSGGNPLDKEVVRVSTCNFHGRRFAKFIFV